MDNKRGAQPLLDDICKSRCEGLGRARRPGELILEKLVGQMISKMILLPTFAAAVAAAAAAARAHLPNRHRAAHMRVLVAAAPALARACSAAAPARCPALAGRCPAALGMFGVACLGSDGSGPRMYCVVAAQSFLDALLLTS